MKQITHLPRIARIVAASVLTAATISAAFAQTVNKTEARNQETWRETISRTQTPAPGCFHASYPSLTWAKVDCVTAPNIPYAPRRGVIGETVGNGNDYAAEVTSGFINTTVGSFPGVETRTETGLNGENDYSLQLNSNFMNTSACNGASDPAKCLDWEQFVYSSGYEVAFMQYWLIYWDTTCPSGWFTYTVSSDTFCYTNSNAVSVPQVEAIILLRTLKLSGSAVKAGLDTLVLAAEREAFSTTGSDSVVDLATAWTESEFNVIGDGDGSEATFSTPSFIKVKVAVSNRTTNVPTCAADSGTTGETNNLNLGSCSSTGGAVPYIEFTESN